MKFRTALIVIAVAILLFAKWSQASVLALDAEQATLMGTGVKLVLFVFGLLLIFSTRKYRA